MLNQRGHVNSRFCCFVYSFNETNLMTALIIMRRKRINEDPENNTEALNVNAKPDRHPVIFLRGTNCNLLPQIE